MVKANLRVRISMIGSPQVLIVEVAVCGLDELAAALERGRWLYGRLVEVDGEQVSLLAALPTSRLQLLLLEHHVDGCTW